MAAAGGSEAGPGSKELLRILISTDNHVGFNEKHPIRGMDSFLAFEEVLAKAQELRVDLVLLSGDLFHENAPSRTTLFRTMEILRKYVMGDNPVRVQVLSDQNLHFGGPRRHFNRANWEDPHYNVELPLFTIHGNHDDPSREAAGGGGSEGGTGESILSAIDILAVANLVNYFGAAEDAGDVSLSPVLLQKGPGDRATRVALYGLGNIRDDRFSRMIRSNAVKFRRPADDADGFFSVFMIHQNRDNRSLRGRPGSLGVEACLPAFLDLVVWGHEHESIPVPETTDRKDSKTYVLQPGSTVATSLCDGEAARKHVFLLEVAGLRFRSSRFPLRCVRPFRIIDVSLASDSGIDTDAPDVELQVQDFLMGQVEALLKEAAGNLAAQAEDDQPPPNMRLPLIRVRVEHSGYKSLSVQRFGTAFVGRVANPADVLLFWRKPRARAAAGSGAPIAPKSLPGGGAAAGLPPVGVMVSDLITAELHNTSLELLESDAMAHAMSRYIGGEAAAFTDALDAIMQRRKDAIARQGLNAEADLSICDPPAGGGGGAAGAASHAADSAAAPPAGPKRRGPAAAGGGRGAGGAGGAASAPAGRSRAVPAKRRRGDDDGDDDDDDEDDGGGAGEGEDEDGGRGGRGRAAAAPAAAPSRSRRGGARDEDDDFDDEEEEDAPVGGRSRGGARREAPPAAGGRRLGLPQESEAGGRSRAAAAAAAPGRGGNGNGARAAPARRGYVDDDEEEEEEEDGGRRPPPPPPPHAAPGRPPLAAAASAPAHRAQAGAGHGVVIDMSQALDSDEDDGGGGGRSRARPQAAPAPPQRQAPPPVVPPPSGGRALPWATGAKKR